MGKYIDRRGVRFGRLVAIKDVGRDSSGGVIWLCKCDCGDSVEVSASCLTTGNTKSCGCLAKEHAKRFVAKATKHGKCNTKLYRIWCSMKHRCTNENDRWYHNYGGRGIGFCSEWSEFEPFFAWAMANGYKEGLTLERVNNDGDYEPNNCAWIPKRKQSGNTRRCVMLTYNNKTMNIKDWARELGLPYSQLQSRIKRGWSTERALTTPHVPLQKRHTRIICYQGECKSLAEWSRVLGIKYKTLHSRLWRGLSVEEAFKK